MIHAIDPVIGSLGGLLFWWYGLSYSLGFLNAHLFLRRNRDRLGLSVRSVYSLTLCLAIGVLAGGRALVVFVHEWSFYRERPDLIPAMWLGGMATHGLLIGGALGVLAFCWYRGMPFRKVFDALAIPAAIIMGCGRVGNFIDGQIVGSVTEVPWGVKFPEADGFRHPVVLYDGLKNFALIPILLWVRSRGAPPGRLAALFVLLYAGLRIPIDLLREYPVNALGLPGGQGFNVIMTVAGALLLARNARLARRGLIPDAPMPREREAAPGAWRRLAFACVLAGALAIPSDATRDIADLYGKRHPGLAHSAMYPPIPRQ